MVPSRGMMNRQQRRSAGVDLFAEAITRHQAGDVARAERLYRRILATNPTHGEALTNLGLALLAQGRVPEAVVVQRRALALRPDAIQVMLNLADTLRAHGDRPAALAAFRHAARHMPPSPVVQNIIGTILAELGQPAEAVAAFQAALAIAPTDLTAQRNLGLTLIAQGSMAAGIAALRAAHALAPDAADILSDLGVALVHTGDNLAAAAACRAAIARDPRLSRAHLNLGTALLRLGDADAALAAFEAARALAPDDAAVHTSIAAAALKRCDLDTAANAARRACALAPRDAEAWVTLGLILHHQGELDAALAAHRSALALDAGFADAEFGVAQVLLAQGDYTAGWRHYEARWRVPYRVSNFRNRLPEPQWQGEPLDGRTILLHYEQGLGDTLQLLRYVPMVVARGGKVLLLVQPPLQPLLPDWPGVTRCGSPAELPDFDLHCPLFSLPAAFGTTVSTIPTPIPYLHADTSRVAHWRERLGEHGGLRVGLVWAGNSSHVADGQRSIPLPLLAPLLDKPGTRLFSLQRDLRPGDADWLARHNIPALGEALDDFADTAAALSAMDLLLSVDTSVAHLAGALGLPAWLLLRAAPEWRWAGQGDASAWYPTIRLLRQPAPGDWAGLIAAAAQALPG